MFFFSCGQGNVRNRVRCVVTVLCALSVGGCASFGTREPSPEHLSVSSSKANDEAAAFDDVALLTEAMLLVRRNYVEEKSFREVVYGAIDGMLSELDPNSSFLPPEPLSQLEEETRGSFGGIGVSVGVDKAGVKVIAPIEDSPAFKAGIQAGDTITAVDGKKLNDVSLDQVVNAMRGEKGSTVKVTLERANGEKMDMSLVRDDIKVPSVKGVRDLGDGVGYLRITQFNEPVAEDFARALIGLEKANLTSLIVDLRDNPGGLLESAVGVTEQVLSKGTEIVAVRGRDGEKPLQRFTAGPCEQRFAELPLVLLVNGGSASASEIMAGALQAHKRAVLVGERTYGKASVQSVIKLALRPDCALRLTTGYYYTPGGKLIHGVGIDPDVEVVVPPSEWRRVQMERMVQERSANIGGTVTAKADSGIKDVQLERAKEVLMKNKRVLNNG